MPAARKKAESRKEREKQIANKEVVDVAKHPCNVTMGAVCDFCEAWVCHGKKCSSTHACSCSFLTQTASSGRSFCHSFLCEDDQFAVRSWKQRRINACFCEDHARSKVFKQEKARTHKFGRQSGASGYSSYWKNLESGGGQKDEEGDDFDDDEEDDEEEEDDYEVEDALSNLSLEASGKTQ